MHSTSMLVLLPHVLHYMLSPSSLALQFTSSKLLKISRVKIFLLSKVIDLNYIPMNVLTFVEAAKKFLI